MYEKFGAVQIKGSMKAEFKIFLPEKPNPGIEEIKVVGNFQRFLPSGIDWDANTGLIMSRSNYDGELKGTLFSCETPEVLPEGFYEYKYVVTFNKGEVRWVSDPCAKYGGTENENSAFVIGGSKPEDNTICKIEGGRKPLKDLIIYELMIDDFTDEYREGRAPLDAVIDKLDYLKELGFNAIEFMPWTAWPDNSFSWGYIPFQFFSVEYRYANALSQPSEKLSWLKKLINECHKRGIYVIMDGVFNHVGLANLPYCCGFPYFWLYKNSNDCPFIGKFKDVFEGLTELNYNNQCTQTFILDVCKYWIDVFGIDGIRFDNTPGFFDDSSAKGLKGLIKDIKLHLANTGNFENFCFILEHLKNDNLKVTNDVDATGCWFNSLYWDVVDYMWTDRVDNRLIFNLLNMINFGEKIPVTYIGNHDHSHIAWTAGAKYRDEERVGSKSWYRTQPYMIALFTGYGAPMIYNGQEFAEEYWIPENDKGTSRRVQPRPLRWSFETDKFGSELIKIYKKLIKIRKNHPALRSRNIYPTNWENWMHGPDTEGYGINEDTGIVIYHRYLALEDGRVERYIIVLNCSQVNKQVSIPFSVNGDWEDLLKDPPHNRYQVENFLLKDHEVSSNWGCIFFNVQ